MQHRPASQGVTVAMSKYQALLPPRQGYSVVNQCQQMLIMSTVCIEIAHESVRLFETVKLLQGQTNSNLGKIYMSIVFIACQTSKPYQHT